jgi:hypothetical protein
MIARASAAAVLAFGLVGCTYFSSSGNSLLQSREGRREVVSLCHEAVQDRLSNTDGLRFASGVFPSLDDPIYYGAVEALAGGDLRRFSFICHVQPSGAVELVFR